MRKMDDKRDAQEALNRSLSGLRENPLLAQRIIAEAKGEKKPMRMNHKWKGLIIALAIFLALTGTAYAAFSSQVAEFFATHWGSDMGDWLLEGKVAQVGESVTVADVSFTLDEVVYRNRGLYGVGTVRALNENDILVPFDYADDPEYFAVNEDAQALARQARETGKRLVCPEVRISQVSVDGGSMLNIGCVGYYDVRNEDGSITFSFEAEDGYALEEGETYQAILHLRVQPVNENGLIQYDDSQIQEWTVAFAPVILPDAPQATAQAEPVAIQQDGYEIVTGPAYQETGTTPVYKAAETNFLKRVDPAWFNAGEVTDRPYDGRYVFADHAELDLSPETISYTEYTDTLYDYNTRERQYENPNVEPMMLPRPALSYDIAAMAGDVYFGYGYVKDQNITLDKTELAQITLAQAQSQAEALIEKLGLKGYACAYALDMSLERIEALGDKRCEFWFGGDWPASNGPRSDYSQATEADEGYFLIYTLEGIDHLSDGRHQISLFINARGIVSANIVNWYDRGEALYTPDSLITPQKAVERLYEEIAHARYGDTVRRVQRVALTYSAVRADNKADGMVLVPVWQVAYLEGEHDGDDYCGWAEFNAVNGALIDAIFQ